MLVNKLGVDVLLLMLCRLRFCKSFQLDNYVYYDLNNSALDFLRLQLHGAIYRTDSFVLMLRCCVNFFFFFYQQIKIQEIKRKNEFTYYKLQRLRWLIRVGNRSKEQKLACCCRSQHKIQWNIFRHVTFTMTSDTIDNRRTTSMLLEVVVGEKVTKTN